MYAEITEWPTLYFESVSGTCPFEKPKERTDIVHSDDQISDKETNKDTSEKELR